MIYTRKGLGRVRQT